ncbi:7249_t:CDS:2 [Dentiscutata erythropus]|uniref:7249_t:CDS:1 n=1 Tax=Dentiscutata erythropus TaxID=1348616 RepID=A0A9N8YR46_9GLOM|nr:7249_t:CDS:2 [Dentiscutata erythropus]
MTWCTISIAEFLTIESRSEISQKEYKFRTEEIDGLKLAIKKLQKEIKSYQEEIDRLTKENEDLYGE